MAVPLVLAAAGGCGGDGTVPLEERASIVEFDVQPRDPTAVEVCELLTVPQAEDLGLVPEEESTFATAEGSPNGTDRCYWDNDEGTSLGLWILDQGTAGPTAVERTVTTGTEADNDRELVDVLGYPAVEWAVSATECHVEVAVSDAHHVSARLTAAGEDDRCGLATRVAETAVDNAPPLSVDADLRI